MFNYALLLYGTIYSLSLSGYLRVDMTTSHSMNPQSTVDPGFLRGTMTACPLVFNLEKSKVSLPIASTLTFAPSEFMSLRYSKVKLHPSGR